MPTLPEILERCQQGDDEAVGQLVALFQPWALDFAAALLNDRQLAPDAVQESFVDALQKLSELRTPEAFPGWFRQIIRTQTNRINRRRIETPLIDGDAVEFSGEGAADRIQREDLQRAVRRAIGLLPALQRDAVELCYLQEMKHAEVANLLNVPIGTVKRRLHDARRALRELLTGIE